MTKNTASSKLSKNRKINIFEIMMGSDFDTIILVQIVSNRKIGATKTHV
jgi:hypothetical protein